MKIYKEVITTSKKHWVNDYRRYGTKWKLLTFQVSTKYGVILSWLHIKDLSIQIYKLD